MHVEISLILAITCILPCNTAIIQRFSTKLIGLINYVYYACKLRGLSAFSGERESLLRVSVVYGRPEPLI